MLDLLNRDGSEDSSYFHERSVVANHTACDLLLARLLIHHPDHAIVALNGVKPADCPAAPDEAEPASNVVPLPTPATTMIRRMRALRPTADLIVSQTAEFYSIPFHTLLSAQRLARVVLPRQIAMYLCCELTALSLKELAREFGRDHTTVLHARRKIEWLSNKIPRLADEIEVVKLKILEHHMAVPA